MNNYKLVIQYNGTNYSGWQIQENAVTVQQKITDALAVLLKEKVNLIGSGRTDAGVHALGQVANFQTERDPGLFEFSYSLNSILPGDIAVTQIEKVGADFHARFSAKKRSYIYLLAHKKTPFYKNYSMQYPPLNKEQINKLNKLSTFIKGEKDFTSFSRKNNEIENKVCMVENIHWRRSGDFTIFFIEANRFLHGMVRTIVGSLLYAERNKLNEDYIKDIFSKKDREAAAEAVVSKGLFLYKVRY